METVASSASFEPAPAVPATSAPPPPVPGPAAPVLPPGGVVYKVDSSKATFAELWRDATPSTFWVAWIAKLMGTRLPGSVNDPNVESLRPFEVQESAVPPDVMSRVAPMLRDLRSLGFDPGPPICHAIVDLFNNSRTWMFALPRADGRAVARVTLRREGSRARPKTHFYCEVLSSLSDGGFLWSTGAKAVLLAPEAIRVRRHVGASAAELWSAHEGELANLPGAAGARRIVGREGTAETLERHHLLVRDFHLRRRLFVPMSEADTRVASSLEATYTRASTDGFAYPEVLAELERLQHRTSSRLGGVVVLVISLVMFVTVGVGQGTGALAAKQTRELLMLLVAILFFHELGHYVAMRVFRYRNVRMFFIPLFGAAVSGTHYSAPGWKKVVVALMGPVPGILVGAVLGIVGVRLHHPLMIRAALMALILNGANLLPVLPLDGGRVVQTLLFARHYAADVAFRAVAVVALIALGALGGGRLYLPLGISMLLTIPLVWRRGRIAAQLRREGLIPRPSDDQRVPPDVARAIITRVMGGAARGIKQNTRTVAQTTLAVYESLCNRPPGWLATLGLGAVHVLAVAIALVMAIVLVIAQGGPLARFARAAAQGPKQAISPSDIVAVGDHRPAAGRKTIVANFAQPAEARSAYGALSQNLVPGEAVERFGQTVLVAFPADDDAARRRHVADAERLTKDVGVDVPGRGRVVFRLNCIVLNEAAATRIEDEVKEYTGAPAALHLIPPWDPAAADPATDWPRCRLARQTYVLLQRAGRGVANDPAQQELVRRLREAYRSGDTAEAERLQAEQVKRMQQRRRQELERLRTVHDGSVDPVVVENYLSLSSSSNSDPDDEEDAPAPAGYDSPPYQAIAARMGQLPLVDGKPAPAAARFAASGFASREGLLLTFHYWTFDDDIEGAPALIRWLADRGCKSMHYEFRTGDAGANPFD